MHTLLVGFDSFDPSTFERLSSEGKMPNLTKYVEAGHYSHLQVSDPPQTEVSWSSIATGLDPGWHGVFDFVHRNPKTYTPFASLLATKKTALGVQFLPPVKANTIFEQAVKDGYPATTLWWPATFPAKPESMVRTIPGLGAPDILGRLGVGTLFTTNSSCLSENRKTSVKSLHKKRKGEFNPNGFYDTEQSESQTQDEVFNDANLNAFLSKTENAHQQEAPRSQTRTQMYSESAN